MGVSAGRQCSGYILKKAACCVSCCPFWKLFNSKGSLSPSQASQESESQPANTGARAGCRNASQTLPAATSSPKSNCTDKGELTKASLETLRTLAMEKEQPCSTSRGCQWGRTGQGFPRVPGAECDSQGKHSAHPAQDRGAGVREHPRVKSGDASTHVVLGALIQHLPSLCTPFLFWLPSCAHFYPGFYIFGLLQPSDFIFQVAASPGGSSSRISVKRICCAALGQAAVPRHSPGTCALPCPSLTLTQAQGAARRVTGQGGQSSGHRAGPRDSLQEATDVSRWHKGPAQGLRTGDGNLETLEPCVSQLSQGMALKLCWGNSAPLPSPLLLTPGEHRTNQEFLWYFNLEFSKTPLLESLLSSSNRTLELCHSSFTECTLKGKLKIFSLQKENSNAQSPRLFGLP